jgi:membrane protein insertase Oxa1/YidC/SpoIIIJ
MGFRFRKSVNLGGGFRTTFSKSGAGFSWGTKGFRVTKKAGGGTRTTVSIPGTGISYSSNGKKGSAGCLTICIVWPLKLCWWMIVGVFWLMWQMCYWTVKLCFVIPIKFIINLIKGKSTPTTTTQQNSNSN